jgi:hypothetical protein
VPYATVSDEDVAIEMPSVRPELLLYFLFLQEGKLQYGIYSRQNVEVGYSCPVLIQHHSTFFIRNKKVIIYSNHHDLCNKYCILYIPDSVQRAENNSLFKDVSNRRRDTR